MRGVRQGACPVPDVAGQQDHPRDRQVSAAREFRGQPVPGPRGGHPGRQLDRQTRQRLGGGQMTQISMRPNANTVFMVLRDPAADMSIGVTCSRDLVQRRSNSPRGAGGGVR